MSYYVLWNNRIMCGFSAPNLARQWCYERGAKDMPTEFDTLLMPDGTLAYIVDEISH